MKPVFRIGISPCPNDTFIFRKWIRETSPLKDFDIVFDFADVQTLNERALQGQYDMVKISFGQLPNILMNYGLLPCGGALGRGCGPLLLQSPNVEFTPKVYLPGVNTTARHLFDFWANSKERIFQREFSFFDDIYRDLISGSIYRGVVIHESRFTYIKDGLELVQDLGEFWEIKTGSPIPLGGIVLHRKHKELADLICEGIRDSIAHSQRDPNKDLEWIQSQAQISDPKVVKNHIKLYVNDFSIDMAEEGTRAVEQLMSHLLGEFSDSQNWMI